VTEDVYLAAEARARTEIDRQLVACGWLVQNRAEMNLYAGQGVAVREFIMASGHGRSDYLLFVDGKAVGAIEAKPSGTPLAGVEPQTAKYAAGLPLALTAVVSPLPFLYESTGDETMFTDGFDPEPRSRSVLTFHRPETLARWLRHWIDDPEGGSLRARLDRLGPVGPEGPEADPGGGDQPHRRVDGAQPSPGAGPDGDRVGQDVHGRQPRLPAGSDGRGGAGAVPGRPGEPRPPDAPGVPAVRHPRRRPPVHRPLQRPVVESARSSRNRRARRS